LDLCKEQSSSLNIEPMGPSSTDSDGEPLPGHFYGKRSTSGRDHEYLCNLLRNQGKLTEADAAGRKAIV
jgi:hypothetical protein